MGRVREQSQGQVLQADRGRPQAAAAADGRMAGNFRHCGPLSVSQGVVMKALWVLWSRITGLFRKNWRERELAAEFESHLQMHIDDNIQAGMTPEQARREALVKFGGMETAKESVRETSRMLWIETTVQDIRYALRGLRLNPGFAATAILSLALGIGASVAIYTVADNLLLRPLPYPGASELAILWETNLRTSFTHNVVSPGNYFDWKKQSTVLENIGGFVD